MVGMQTNFRLIPKSWLLSLQNCLLTLGTTGKEQKGNTDFEFNFVSLLLYFKCVALFFFKTRAINRGSLCKFWK